MVRERSEVPQKLQDTPVGGSTTTPTLTVILTTAVEAGLVSVEEVAGDPTVQVTYSDYTVDFLRVASYYVCEMGREI